MAQRDYVRRGQSAAAPSRRKKSKLIKKQNSRLLPAVLPTMCAIAAVVLVAFISGLYFITHYITHYKKDDDDSEALQQYHKVTGGRGSCLPPPPEERWHYIKELESRQPGVRWTKESSIVNGEMKKSDQIINEQHHHSQAIQPKQKQKTATALQLLPPSALVMRDDAEALKQNAIKKNERHWWMIQCGSFKGVEQAETVSAQLTFKGFNSHITTNNGWNRVVIGPIDGKDHTDDIINRLKFSCHLNCIRLASGGG